MEVPANLRNVYSIDFPASMSDMEVERFMIQRGGQWVSDKTGKTYGNGLFFHYRALQSILWPEEDHHRWSDLILKEILQNNVTVLMGAKDSGKTHGMTKFCLTDYFCFPNNTMSIISSTTLASLEGRVWGDIKNMFSKAKERFPSLTGVVVDNKHAICTDDLRDKKVLARDMRKGIWCLPCLSPKGGRTNIAGYIGMKQERRRYYADELSEMSLALFDSLANVFSGNFKMIAAGNPIGEDDPLDKISEPAGGWQELGDIEKTTTWDNKLFIGSRTINLVGTDSPNFDQSQIPKPKYWYLTNQASIDQTVSGFGKDSWQYWSQCVGVRRQSMQNKRVLTQVLCENGGAFEEVIWDGSKPRIKVGGLDAAYGGTGGDRCVFQMAEWGYGVDGRSMVAFFPPTIIPVSVRLQDSPEDQIAGHCKRICDANGISANRFFYDSTGRGSLGIPLAKLFSSDVVPVEFGGKPDKVRVSLDMFIVDQSTMRRRPLMWDEHSGRKVTQLWFNFRYSVEAGQVRGLPKEVAEELYKRSWSISGSNKIEVETKADMKVRTGRSPDLADAAVIALYGALKNGFQISKMGNNEIQKQGFEWLEKLSGERSRIIKSHELIEV